MRMIHLPSGESVPCLGQGTWFMGEDSGRYQKEIEALQHGIELGMRLIDTAEMYGNGAAEQLVGKAIQGRREQVILVSKVLPYHADFHGTQLAFEASLKRLKTEYIDIYLLHWRGNIPLEETIAAMTLLKQQGKIRHWGVSNFDVDDLQALEQEIDAQQLATNQVLYNLTRRGIEFDLLPYSQQHNLPTMAYSPIEQGRLLRHPVLCEIGKALGKTPAQIALAWVLLHTNIIAIPKASHHLHVAQNYAALDIQFSEEQLVSLDNAFPPPKQKCALEMI